MMKNQDTQYFELLKSIVEWWDEWTNSESPTELEDPPIEEARILLKLTSN